MVMLLSAVLTSYLESVRQAWEFALESGAGIGLVLILRWYWWRVNAASEISVLVAAAVGFFIVRLFTPIPFPETLLYLVPWTTAWWLLVTWLTPPEPMHQLVAFYRRVLPGGPGWREVATRAGEPQPERIGGWLLEWAAGCGLVYGVLFGVGSMLFGSAAATAGWFSLAAAAGAWLYYDLGRRGWDQILE